MTRGFRGFGDGEGDAVACGCAKHKVANAKTSSAARGRCLFIRRCPPRLVSNFKGAGARRFLLLEEHDVNDCSASVPACIKSNRDG